MNWIGCVLLLSGWAIVMAALVLLQGLGQQFGFVAAGLLVELLGLGLLAYGYMLPQRGESKRGNA